MDHEQQQESATPARKTRFRVTAWPPSPPPEAAPEGEPTGPAAEDSTLVEGGAPARPLTEPVPGARPGGHHTYFVYADTAEEAKHKVREEKKLLAEHELRAEEAGYVEDGVVHFPHEEEVAAQASMQDGRKAPGA
jgi:hypothetical protein